MVSIIVRLHFFKKSKTYNFRYQQSQHQYPINPSLASSWYFPLCPFGNLLCGHPTKYHALSRRNSQVKSCQINNCTKIMLSNNKSKCILKQQKQEKNVFTKNFSYIKLFWSGQCQSFFPHLCITTALINIQFNHSCYSHDYTQLCLP